MKIWIFKIHYYMFQTWVKKTTCKRYQILEFQTLKDTTSIPATLLYKNPPLGRASKHLFTELGNVCCVVEAEPNLEHWKTVSMVS